MSRRSLGRIIGAMLVTILLFTTIPSSTLANQPGGTQVSLQSTSAPRATFVFGKRGDNLRPLALTIYDTGIVTGFYTLDSRPPTQVHPKLRLSQDVLAGLVKLTQAEGFFTLPQLIGRATFGSSARFITVHTVVAERTVTAWNRDNAAFNQLYAVLLAVSGVPSSS